MMELTVESKLLMLEQSAKQEPDRYRQQLAVSILTSCKGRDLYTLKDGFDIGHVEMDFAKLIFNWLTDDGLRAIVLTHVKIQSKALLEQEDFKRPLRVLSDIDDTLVHSGFGECVCVSVRVRVRVSLHALMPRMQVWAAPSSPVGQYSPDL